VHGCGGGMEEGLKGRICLTAREHRHSLRQKRGHNRLEALVNVPRNTYTGASRHLCRCFYPPIMGHKTKRPK
jgi:hypothetical protein